MNREILAEYQLEFKDVTLNDLDNMIGMYIETFNSEPWNDKWTEETAYKRLHAMINVEDFYGLCAYKNDQLCGVIIGCKEEFYDRTIFNLREFFVNNSLRGQGIGSKMMIELDKRLQIQGVKEIILYTIRNIMTEGFYEKCGFNTYDNMVVMGKNLAK
ncbi:GNAT family N-acetyltransferase [Clostridium sp. SM-530-WT-3G]|uniref:GNAT family N-acetyltransferase n=1 Tax=Clostridium sp. SM-530-WT-3G TaxID=2725303 RepID=UPI00145F0EFD|nr:GNAT family N-acetyltransferase [Clostridium sp. SM-530-WT-3G]NME81616.1 GNAT family N-acetyltransferase [Clostridium sp. SM-530-WT-3G]